MVGEQMDGWPTGTVTFLFTDVEGSTRLWAEDPAAMSTSLQVHDEILRQTIESHAGVVFTTAGDSFAAAFQRASDAVLAASVAQDRLKAASWPGPALQVRMGLHLGEAEERDGDYFGPVVNMAARVEAAGHGGQILITETVKLAASLDPTELGSHLLRDIDEPMALYQVGSGEFPHLRVVDATRSNLPSRPTRLIGREDDVARVQRLLATDRLVTVTAVGGIGKTRLAIAIGEAELANRVDGVWFVDLTALSSGADVAGAVANSVGLQLRSGDATEQVVRFLAEKDVLVIVDNCEHVVDEIADLMDAFLAVPGPARVLATSREVLDVDGERNVVLRPLDADDAGSPAVRLFLDRVTAVGVEAKADEASLATISAICNRLDGMPLAIELAAARVAVMSLDDVLAGLDDRFQLLSGGRRRRRDRTLEATLDWSYDLLSGEEQTVLRSLGVFLDGFDVDSVARVANLSKHQAVVLVEALLAKSLIVRADHDDRVRFRLLETVKSYAEKRLVDSNEAGDVRDRHLEYFHALSMREGRTTCGGTLGMGRLLRLEVGNISAAVERAVATDRLDVAAETLTASTMAFFLAIRLPELAEMLERVSFAANGESDAAGDQLDDDLLGCLRSTVVWVNVFLANWDVVHEERETLQLSADPWHRALGSAIHAFLSARSSPTDFEARAERAESQLAEAELDAADTQSPASNVAMLARWMLADARASHALLECQFDTVLDLFEEVVEASANIDDRVYSHISITTAAATAQILLGLPENALETIAWLSEVEVGYYDGTEVRAVAHLRLGDVDSASRQVRLHAIRGASGRLPWEASDSVILLAELARAEGNDALARRLLLVVGRARQYSTHLLRNLLAEDLGIVDECAAAVAGDTAADVELSETFASAIVTTRAELVRRGWS